MTWLEFDQALFLWINGLSGHVNLIDNIMRALANDYFAIITGCLVMAGLWAGISDNQKRRHTQKGIMVASSSLGISQVMVEVINGIWARPRPFTELNVNLVFYMPTDASFPANSSTVLFGMAWGLFLYSRKAGTVLLCLAAVKGFSRIYVGVHYPLDVVSGAVIGLTVALFFLVVFKLFNPLIDRLINLLRWFFLA